MNAFSFLYRLVNRALHAVSPLFNWLLVSLFTCYLHSVLLILFEVLSKSKVGLDAFQRLLSNLFQLGLSFQYSWKLVFLFVLVFVSFKEGHFLKNCPNLQSLFPVSH